MAAIDWTYVGSLGGEYIENFAAACLRQRYPNALQTKPAQGDGGVDVYRETAEGFVVWQIKRFTTALSASQRKQVERSWKRFWVTHVIPGKRISQYYLATPNTPTDEAREWFADLTKEAEFPAQWDGEAFFNGLASDYPGTADRFFKGADMLESMVNAKAILSSSPVETADSATMLQALERRESALREIRDLVSDNYYVDTGTRTSKNSDPPLPGPDEVGLYYRYTYLGDNRFQVDTIVAKNDQSTEIEPLRVQVKFDVEPGSEEEGKVREWLYWGVPFQDVPGSSQQEGGPFADSDPQPGLLSFVAVPSDPKPFDLFFRQPDAAGLLRDVLKLTVREATRGLLGGGVRVFATSPSKIVQVDMRRASDEADDSLDMWIADPTGLDPLSVSQDLQALGEVMPELEFSICMPNGAPLVVGSGLSGRTDLRAVLLQLCADLDELQSVCETKILLPAMSEITPPVLGQLHDLAEGMRGRSSVRHWERLTLVVDDADGWRSGFADGGKLIHVVERPTIGLGSAEFCLGLRIVRTIYSFKPAPGSDIDGLRSGDEIEIIPGEDDRITMEVAASPQVS